MNGGRAVKSAVVDPGLDLLARLARRLAPDDPDLMQLSHLFQRMGVVQAEQETAIADLKTLLAASERRAEGRAGRRAALGTAVVRHLATLRCDGDLRLVEVNPAAAQMTGLAVGGSLVDWLTPQEASDLKAALVGSGVARVDLSCCLALALPGQGAHDLVLVPVPGEAGEAATPLLRQILEDCEDEVFAVDGQGRVIFANRSWLAGQGVKEGVQAAGAMLADLMPLHQALREGEGNAAILRPGAQPTLVDLRREEKFSPPRRLRQRKLALTDAAGRTVGVATRTRDVTETARLAEDLKFANLVLEQLLDSILVTDAGLRVRNVNPAFVKLTGFSTASLRGKALEALLPPGDAEGVAAWKTMVADLRKEGRWQGELSLRGAGGSRVIVWCSASQLHDETGRVFGYVLVQSDVTRLYAVQAENERLARYDTLTHLPNRKLIADRLEESLRLARRNHKHFAVIFLDLDAFKSVNDSLGHSAGDQLLVVIAERLVAALGPGDMVARIGGDEFLLLLPDCEAERAAELANALLDRLGLPVDLEGLAGYRPSASLGIALYPDHGLTASEFLRSADTAMYAAKVSHQRVAFFQSDMRREATHLLDLRNALTGAVERGEFQLFYQPIYRLTDGMMTGAEALLRWARPGHGILLPGDFLPIAEMAGLMRDIDKWVLQRAAADLAGWRASGLLGPGWRLSINQTAEDLALADWVPNLQRAVDVAGPIGMSGLQIELTEGHVTGSLEALQRSLRALGPLGVRLAVDDFGTGYSNLSYLRSLPISTIKIDRGFVAGLESDPDSQILVRAMIGLGQQFGYETLAEGIETEGQAEFLRAAGCDLGQGFLMARPLDPAAFTRRLRTEPVVLASPAT